MKYTKEEELEIIIKLKEKLIKRYTTKSESLFLCHILAFDLDIDPLDLSLFNANNALYFNALDFNAEIGYAWWEYDDFKNRLNFVNWMIDKLSE